MKAHLDHYRIFCIAASERSFSRAAGQLYISQSAVSQCISQLESDLQTQLFVRSRRGVYLTKAGEMLYQKVKNALSMIEQGERQLDQLLRFEEGSLHIAAGDTITSRYLLPYLEQFHIQYPKIRIEMANSYSSDMIRRIKQGKADLAFINLPYADDELIIRECLPIHDIFVAGARFEARSSYSPAQIAALPLILLEKNSTSRRSIDAYFARHHIALQPQIEIAAHELLLQFASIHLGVSCVIKEFSIPELNSGIVRELTLDAPLPVRGIGCAYLRSAPLSPSAAAFLALLDADENKALRIPDLCLQ